MKFRILFVCLGNICRSPTAEAICAKLVESYGLGDSIDVDSAGLADWHVGKAPDPRSQSHGLSRGYDLSHLKARAFSAKDFQDFDLILAMDESNVVGLAELDRKATETKVRLLTSYCQKHKVTEVPDPYYGNDQDFELVIDIVEDACAGLLQKLPRLCD